MSSFDRVLPERPSGTALAPRLRAACPMSFGRTVRALLAGSALVLGLAAGAAQAQEPTYSADEVIKHFEAQRAVSDGKPVTRGLTLPAASRGVCIGTRDECGGETSPKTATSASPDVKPGVSIASQSDGSDDASAPQGEGFNLLVSFEYNSFALSEAAKANLREFAKGISDPSLSDAVFLIEGHTDGFGSADYNQELSENRAAAVVEYLVSLGIDASRLEAVGRGKSMPKVADPFDERNRRVEGRLMAKQ